MNSSYHFSKDVFEHLHKIIGANVKRIRTEKGFSQLELSYAMGNKSVSLISAAELANDNKRFNINHLYKISKVLDVPICEFFKDVDELKNKQ